MKKKFGKFLSILLTAVMLVGMLPATAMAEETPYAATLEDVDLGVVNYGENTEILGKPAVTNIGTERLWLTDFSIELTDGDVDAFRCGWNSGPGSIATGQSADKPYVWSNRRLDIGTYEARLSLYYDTDGASGAAEPMLMDTATVRIEVKDPNAIEPVEVKAISVTVSEPVAGDTADTSGIKINSAGLSVRSANWYAYKENQLVSVDRFTGGKTYHLIIEYDIADGYTVSNDAKVLHNLSGGKANRYSEGNAIEIEYKVKELTITIRDGVASWNEVDGADCYQWTLANNTIGGIVKDDMERSIDLQARLFSSGKESGTYTFTVQAYNGNEAVSNLASVEYVYTTTHTHDWAVEWTTNDNYHWHNCKNDGCGVTANNLKPGHGYHTFEGDTCTVCGKNASLVDAPVITITDGIASWTQIEGTWRYWWGLDNNTIGGWAEPGETINLNKRLADSDRESGTYSFTIQAFVSQNTPMSEKATVYHEYTKPDPLVPAPTIKIEDGIASWTQIEGTWCYWWTLDNTIGGWADPGETINLKEWLADEDRESGEYLFTVQAFVNNYTAKSEKASEYYDYTISDSGTTPATYTVNFYANDGSGTKESVTVASGEYTLPECGFTAPEGMRFKAWRIEGDEYAVGETITISKDTWALAVWEYIPNPVINTINIKGITAPFEGGTAVTTGITTDTEGLVVNTVQWLTNTSTVMTDQKFEAGETYYLFVRFETDTDHTVSDGAEVKHDLPNGTLDRFDRTEARSPWIRIEYTVPGGTPKTPIESVKISGVTEPVVGDKPDFDITLTGEGVAFDKEDYEDGICWCKYADGEWESLDADTTFGAGTYVLDVYLKVKDGYKLTRDTKYSFGEDELPDWEDVDFGVSCYSKYGDYVMLEIFFDVKDSDIPASYTVSFDSNGGSAVTAQTIEAGQKATKPADPTKADYVFKGWTLDGADYDFSTPVNGNITLVAKWEAVTPVPETYDVTVTTGGNGTASANPAAAAEGETVKLTATPESGYEFEKWEVVSAPDGTIVNIENGKFTMPAGAVTVKAIFKEKAAAPVETYTVTVENGTGDGEYAAGAEVTITADSRSGYKFVKWTSDDVTVRNDKDATTAFIMPDKDVTVTAVYEKVSSGSSGGGGSTKYKVTVEDTDNGTVESNRTRASKGTTITITVDPEAGYEVDDIVVETKAGKEVEVTDKGEGKFTFKMPAANVTVSVDFAKTDVEDSDAKEEVEYIQLTIDSVIAWVFDEYVANDVAPVIRNARTMLPARFVAEALGGVVTWNEEAQKVTIVNGEDTIEIFIGEPFATVDGNPVELDSPAFIENSRTYLPIRFIAENMGATVTWDADARTVTITP